MEKTEAEINDEVKPLNKLETDEVLELEPAVSDSKTKPKKLGGKKKLARKVMPEVNIKADKDNNDDDNEFGIIQPEFGF